MAKKDNNRKRLLYLSLTVLLGLLLSFIAHAAIEVAFLRYAATNYIEITWVNGCTLPVWLKIALPILGIIGGYFLGVHWWRIIYIEKRRTLHWFKK